MQNTLNKLSKFHVCATLNARATGGKIVLTGQAIAGGFVFGGHICTKQAKLTFAEFLLPLLCNKPKNRIVTLNDDE